MNKLDIGLRISIDSYILELRKNLNLMYQLQEEYHNNFILSTKSKLKEYFFNKYNDIQDRINQYTSLIDTLFNYINTYAGEENV